MSAPKPSAYRHLVETASGLDDVATLDGVCHRLDDAAAAWPTFEVGAEAFVAHVFARTERGPAEDPTQGLCLADLYLACGCVQGLDDAVEALVRAHASDLASGLGCSPADVEDDAFQELLVALTVGVGDRPPKLDAYSGRGPLGRWLKVVARRRSLDGLRRNRSNGSSDDAGDDLLAVYGDPETALIKGGRNRALSAALREGAALLAPRDRNILRYHYVHRLRLDEIAGIYRISRSTAARRLAQARTSLIEHAREAMCAALGLTSKQLDAELEALSGLIDMSVGQLLREPER